LQVQQSKNDISEYFLISHTHWNGFRGPIGFEVFIVSFSSSSSFIYFPGGIPGLLKGTVNQPSYFAGQFLQERSGGLFIILLLICVVKILEAMVVFSLKNSQNMHARGGAGFESRTGGSWGYPKG